MLLRRQTGRVPFPAPCGIALSRGSRIVNHGGGAADGAGAARAGGADEPNRFAAACRPGIGCYRAGMTDDRLILAIGRLEQALTRLETAPRPAAEPAADHALRQRHEALRGRTQEAIDRLDALLGDAA